MSSHLLEAKCEALRSLHRPGAPLVLTNAWDAASARAVVAAGFPTVGTTSGGVAACLGFGDHEGAPPDAMFAAAARICASVDVPVTVDAEAGYGMEPARLVEELGRAGAAGCNLEDTDHASGELRDPATQAAYLRSVREAANARNYPLVINARIDSFLVDVLAGSERPQGELVGDALRRAVAYTDAGADCVFPIAIWQRDALEQFIAGVGTAVNVLETPRAPSLGELANLGVARISYGSFLHREVLQAFERSIAEIATSCEAWRT